MGNQTFGLFDCDDATIEHNFIANNQNSGIGECSRVEIVSNRIVNNGLGYGHLAVLGGGISYSWGIIEKNYIAENYARNGGGVL